VGGRRRKVVVGGEMVFRRRRVEGEEEALVRKGRCRRGEKGRQTGLVVGTEQVGGQQGVVARGPKGGRRQRRQRRLAVGGVAWKQGRSSYRALRERRRGRLRGDFFVVGQ